MTLPATERTTFRVLVVDDEALARETLRLLLEADAEIDGVGEATNAADAITMIHRAQPDVVLLDVQMPGMGGFDVIAALPPAARPEIVFVTAQDGHALRAFDVAAVDYLLKPFDDHRFALALARAKERVRACRLRSASSSPPRAPSSAAMREPPTAPRVERLIARSAGRAVLIHVADIEYIEAQDYYVLVHASGGSHLVRESMKDLEHCLPRSFVRIHRSTLVNAACVVELVSEPSGDDILVLRSGARVRAARGKRDKILNLLVGA